MVAQTEVARAGKEKTAGEVIEAISGPQGGPRVAGSESRSDVRVADSPRDEEQPSDY